MKTKLILAVICLILFACTGENKGFLSPPVSITEHDFTYHFDENSGAVAVNSDNPGYYDCVLSGPSWVPGKIGSALHFGSIPGSWLVSSVSPNAVGPTNISFDTNSISIGAWIKLDTTPQWTYHIVGNGYYGIKSFRLQINTNSQVEFILSDTNYGWHPIVTSNQVLSPNTWYYIAVTYDETIGRIYINGVEDNTNAVSVNILSDYGFYVGAFDNDVNATPNYQNQFMGIIDELVISKDLWTAQKISDYYNANN